MGMGIGMGFISPAAGAGTKDERNQLLRFCQGGSGLGLVSI